VQETADACSFVLDVPGEFAPEFAYEPGQFCNFRLLLDGEPHIRCYSMSSAPAVDAELQVTVKRVPGGVVSNRMIDTLSPGDVIEVSRPAGFFRLTGDGDVVAFAGGSGITPVFSLIKTALATTSRRIRLLYANRDRDSVIFAAELERLVEEHGDRLTVVHHLDVEHGFVGPDDVREFVEGADDPQCYICGPDVFMTIVEDALGARGVDAGRIHIERFTRNAAPEPAGAETNGCRVTIELDGRTDTTDHHSGTTILQTARQMGMAPPFSCESGNCATCMAKLVDGEVSMFVNNVLDDDEVADGWILTCQSVPTSPAVHVVYES
jgi:ferredoxin-NADP reductase